MAAYATRTHPLHFQTGQGQTSGSMAAALVAAAAARGRPAGSLRGPLLSVDGGARGAATIGAAARALSSTVSSSSPSPSLFSSSSSSAKASSSISVNTPTRALSSSSSSPLFGGGGGSSKTGGGGGGAISFDTYKVHQSLQEAGFSKKQAETILDIVTQAIDESTARSTALIATKRDLLDLKAELTEKVFNSTMRVDISQRHTKEVFEKDMLSLKSDLLAKTHLEIQRVEREIVNIEKVLTDRHMTRRELTEQRVTVLQNEIAQVEKRILQYGAGTLISLLTVGLGFARLLM